MKSRLLHDREAELRSYRHILERLPEHSPNRKYILKVIARLEGLIAAQKKRRQQ